MLNSLCCMRLNTAGVVFGWLGVFGSFVLTIVVSTILGYSDVIAKGIAEHNQDIKYEEVHTVLISVCSVYLAIIVMNLMASGMLVWGTIKERHLMLLPWLINSGISLVFNIIYNVAFLNVTITQSENIFPVFILSLIILSIQAYIYYGIYSLYKHIQRNRDQQQPLMSQSQGLAVPNQGNSYPNYTKI